MRALPLLVLLAACDDPPDDGASPTDTPADDPATDDPGPDDEDDETDPPEDDPPPPTRENVLVVVMDDIGVDHVGAYGLGDDAPPTPTLDGLADEGVRFRKAWATPMCSPTRAALLTGRYGRRFGIGRALGAFVEAVEVPPETPSLPVLLDEGTDGAYAHAAIGKWHVGSALLTGASHPQALGFGHYQGNYANPMRTLEGFDGRSQDYFDWEETVDGVVTRTDRYLTTETVDDALAWATQAREPWLLYLAFNAAHRPFHVPPEHLHTRPLSPSPTQDEMYDAMVESLDTELGRLLDGLDPEVLARTHVLVVGDNGTPPAVVGEVFDFGKTTLHQGGVRVPLIVAGPAVGRPGSVSDALVHVVDLLPTVAELVDVPLDPGLALDGVSFAEAIADPDAAGPRTVVYTERFEPNGVGVRRTVDEQAAWDGRFKLVRRTNGREELYDLDGREQEGAPLEPPLDADAEAALVALRAEIDRVLASP